LHTFDSPLVVVAGVQSWVELGAGGANMRQKLSFFGQSAALPRTAQADASVSISDGMKKVKGKNPGSFQKSGAGVPSANQASTVFVVFIGRISLSCRSRPRRL